MLHSGHSEKGEQILNKETLKLISTNFLDYKCLPIEIATIGIVKDKNYVNGLEAYGWGLVVIVIGLGVFACHEIQRGIDTYDDD